MTYQNYEKVIGETFFEANLNAEQKFGKGNFQVITSKRIKHSIYFGFGSKEMVELTIGIAQARSTSKTENAPARPLPSVEISQPPKPHIYKPSEPLSPQPESKPVSINHPGLGIKAYNVQKAAPTQMREVHGLRSIQEGAEEPHSQKLADDGLQAEQINNLLAEIIAVKDERQRRDRIANLPQPTARKVAEKPKPAPIVETVESPKMLQAMEERINEIMLMLQKMNGESKSATEKKVPDLPEGLFEIKKCLLDIETPVEIADQIVFELRDCLPANALRFREDAVKITTQWLERRLRFSPEPDFRRTTGPRIIVLIGPTGVGKTTTIAKLAASYGLNIKDRKSVALFTLDTFRIGAAQQLQHYAQIIDVDMEVLYRPEEIDTALANHQDKDLIIVDTAGRCQKDTDELCELGSFIEKLPAASRHLVLSATTKYSDMIDTVNCFSRVGFDHLIFTKVDETNTIGALLAILFKTGKSLAYITNGQRVPDDFHKAEFNFFNHRLFRS